MIFDTLSNLKKYATLHPDIEKAITFLQTPQCLQQPDGRYALSEQSYVILQSYETKPVSQVKYEAHHMYADIQIILSGKELISYAPSAALQIQIPYDAQKDIAFGDVLQPAADLCMAEKMFALFLPGEAHRPCVILEDVTPVRKLVVKLPMGQ